MMKNIRKTNVWATRRLETICFPIVFYHFIFFVGFSIDFLVFLFFIVFDKNQHSDEPPGYGPPGGLVF